MFGQFNFFVSQVNDAAVMVWIHGGAFETGSSSIFLYNAEPLSAVGDVIVVSINYRLSTFGFLTTGKKVQNMTLTFVS